jgi:hypothetical protein
MFPHHPIRNPQQTYAKGSQGVFLNSFFPHLVRLRVNTAVKLDGQSMFEAVEIQDPTVNPELTAKFRTQPPAAPQAPGCLFSFGLAAAQFANSWRGSAHGGSITTMQGIG